MVDPKIQKMLEHDGLYVLTMPDLPNAIVPICVIGGRAYSMKIDNPLSAEGFNKEVIIEGPYGMKPV